MFKIGEYVIHRTNGICLVQETVKMALTSGGNKKDYLLLIPINQPSSKVYMSVENADTSLRRVMTEEEAEALIASIPQIEELSIDNDKQREEAYKTAIKSCDGTELIKVIKTLYIRKTRRLLEGKKITSTDEKYFKLAEENLFSELAFAAHKDREEMKDCIVKKIKAYFSCSVENL